MKYFSSIPTQSILIISFLMLLLLLLLLHMCVEQQIGNAAATPYSFL
jgi:hypothetical protein